jgi:hypothetical protein
VCGADVTSAVLQILREEEILEEINKILIVIIPKVASPRCWGSRLKTKKN